jgi:hypothetical protein
MVRLLRRVTGVVLTGAAVLLAPAVASAEPTGTVSGWRSPVAGAMTLTVSAVPDGAALSSASVTLGGVPVGSAPFANGDCSDGCLATAVVDVDTTSVPDGSRELVVTVVDALGESHELDLPDDPLMLIIDKRAARVHSVGDHRDRLRHHHAEPVAAGQRPRYARAPPGLPCAGAVDAARPEPPAP